MEICEKFVTLLSLRVDGLLPEEEENLLNRHLDACPNCRTLLDVMALVDGEIRELDEDPPDTLVSGIMKQIKKTPARFFFSLRRVGSLAAVLVIAVAAYFTWTAFQGGSGGLVGAGDNTYMSAADAEEQASIMDDAVLYGAADVGEADPEDVPDMGDAEFFSEDASVNSQRSVTDSSLLLDDDNGVYESGDAEAARTFGASGLNMPNAVSVYDGTETKLLHTLEDPDKITSLVSVLDEGQLYAEVEPIGSPDYVVLYEDGNGARRYCIWLTDGGAVFQDTEGVPVVAGNAEVLLQILEGD